MNESDTLPISVKDEESEKLLTQLSQESLKNQLSLIKQFKETATGIETLKQFLNKYHREPVNLAIAKAYQSLWQLHQPEIEDFLKNLFPEGLLPLKSERQIDYQLLAQLLLNENFQAADALTREKFCELAGAAALKRKWVYFTEVEQFPSSDLYTINQLWWLYSEGKFGFEVQRRLWLGVGQDFIKLWPKIGWKNGNNWTKYPEGFTWDLSAPVGHLPLSNQLRGVRVIASLFAHPVWQQVNNSQ